MSTYNAKIQQYIKENNIQAEHLVFSESCHSVADAAKAVDASPEEFVKNICFVDESKKNHWNNEEDEKNNITNNDNNINDDIPNNLIVVIVKGEDKVDANKIANVLKILKPRIATPEQILEKTGYPCGGTPSFGYDAVFLVDNRVMEKEIVYTGGGSVTSLIKVSTNELLKANKGKVAEIKK